MHWLGRGLFLILSLTAVLVTLGCSRTAPALPAKVSGRVTFQGRSLTDGLIVFVPNAERGSSSGKLLSANINSNGEFTLAEGEAVVIPGWYRIAISEPAAFYESSGFPASLRRPDLSGLEREVLPGHEHQFDFQIELTR